MQRSMTLPDMFGFMHEFWLDETENIDDMGYRFINELRAAMERRGCDSAELFDGVRLWCSVIPVKPSTDFLHFLNDCIDNIGSPMMEFEDE